MGIIGTLVKHPDEIPPLIKLKIAAHRAQKAIPKDPNLAFCYRMLTRVSRSFSIVIQQLSPELRDADQAYRYRRPRGGARYQLLFPLVRVNFELGVIMVIAVSCVKLLSAHNSTQHTSRKHKV